MEQYLRCYVNWEQNNWATLLPTAQTAYNSNVSESTRTTPFYANYGIKPDTGMTPLRETEEAERAILESARMKQLHEQLVTELQFIQERMKRYDTRIEGPTLERGDKVYLIRKNIRTKRPSDKLDFKKIGPFKINKKISAVNYKLELPETIKIHPVFHVSLLEPAHDDTPVEDSIYVETEEQEYQVEKILDSMLDDAGKIKYLTKWKNYPHEDNTWEPLRNLANCRQLLTQFHLRNPDRPQETGSLEHSSQQHPSQRRLRRRPNRTEPDQSRET